MSTRVTPKVGATARVQVTLDIEAPSSWGSECAVHQIHKQAVEEVLHVLYQKVGSDARFKVVGEPEVSIVTLVKVTL